MSTKSLHERQYEHDSCGVGLLANLGEEKSHVIIEQGIEVLENLLHRGATGSDASTGDGAGLLFQIPHELFIKESEKNEISLPGPGLYGVGMLFLPQDDEQRERCKRLVDEVIAQEDFNLIWWREVPTDYSTLGENARTQAPAVEQCFVASKNLSGEALERKLYVLRKQIEKRISKIIGEESKFHICSFSCIKVVYKGLLLPAQVPVFYSDLQNPDAKSAAIIVHQRYSTNTFPSWPLAQPFRYLAHNGEINTLRGNLNWMRSREQNLSSDLFGEDIKKIIPIIESNTSDSGCLDNALELLVHGGRSIYHAMAMLVPQAWGNKYPMGPDLRGFFEYHAGLMEPWDGPAAVAFMDNRYAGALLDRSGLRPARYTVTKSGLLIMASEVGVLDIPAGEVEEKGALRPGEMILVDFAEKRLVKDREVKMKLARQQPYRRWVAENKISVHGFFGATTSLIPDTERLYSRQRLFGYTREDIDTILDPMASHGHEPIGSMGADQPLAVLSEKTQSLYWYFKQLFAQVTNPAIDPIREELVMSLMTFLGTKDNILDETPEHSRLVKLNHPILSNDDLHRIRNLSLKKFSCVTLKTGFEEPANGATLKNALEGLNNEADRAVSKDVGLIVLSDRDLDEQLVPIPALLAVSSINQHLVRRGTRTSVGIIVETAEAREVMHMALLLGYGASAINPYLAFETVAHLARANELKENVGVAKAIENYVSALCKGLLKIMSKNGISTLRSYRSAQAFEAVGLNSEVIDKYFTGTASRIGGLGLEEIAREAHRRYQESKSTRGEVPVLLPSGGQYSFRHDGERHLWNPDTISLLQRATRTGDRELYNKFASLIDGQEQQQSTLRGLFRFKKMDPIPLEEVEPAAEIVQRFVSGAMSFGSISQEAHETLAIAMNRLGGMSNSGEGGEDSARYTPTPGGDSRMSAIKQVASGRFGVTAEYLVNARDIQIKISQGAKPGEGGQLPGHKVDVQIARVRKSTAGVTLLSPSPHHDIYSIEDIAQLIFDLRMSNPDARISVKLVSEAGVGTVAAGVAKARADVVVVSGYDGGTGAAPLSSIKHTGVSWELGLAETQQTLVNNGLRDRVRLQVDGQLRTGKDVVVGALLGAEEFGFATSLLIIMGCVMMRKCHNNTCPVGVATQDPELRKRFTGKPEHIVNFFMMLAEEVREILAQLGFKKMDEIIGRSDLLEKNDAIQFWKARGLDFAQVHYRPLHGARRYGKTEHKEIEQSLDYQLLPQLKDAIENGTKVSLKQPIRNIHRAVGTMISSKIAKKYGDSGLPDDTVILEFEGAAGQSFGAFASPGMTLNLAGEANDYLGKGLSGGKIVVRPYGGAEYDPAENTIAGNVLLYGATSGEVYINGRVGERFAIRNSGAVAVVEGVGDHGCEYMTRGRVVILGSTGVNFGAGMSGGIAYVYDETGMFDERCNLEMIDLELVVDEEDIQELRTIIERHCLYANSVKAAHILENWNKCLPYFIKVFPMEYRRALGQMSEEDRAIDRKEIVHL